MAKQTSKASEAPKKRRRKSQDWNVLTAELPEEDIIEYNMTEDFTEAKGIQHKRFGLGVIYKVLSDEQIQVIFEDSTKVLVHNFEPA